MAITLGRWRRHDGKYDGAEILFYYLRSLMGLCWRSVALIADADKRSRRQMSSPALDSHDYDLRARRAGFRRDVSSMTFTPLTASSLPFPMPIRHFDGAVAIPARCRLLIHIITFRALRGHGH